MSSSKSSTSSKAAEWFVEHQVPLDAFRDVELRWNGWGYAHSFFALNQEGHFCMFSKKYEDLDGKPLTNLRPWVEKNLGIDLVKKTPGIQRDSLELPAPIVNAPFYAFLRSNSISFSNFPQIRLSRSHGQTLGEILSIRSGRIGRIPDLVVWPKNEEQIQKILKGANQFNVLFVPIGGGTSVSQALLCSQQERRCICSMDMGLMNRILAIDSTNMTVTAESGILGQHLENQLNESGLTCGHEPDSLEFRRMDFGATFLHSISNITSIFPFWTRASGMKKNKYGNIEDLLLSARLCTPRGIFEPRKLGQVPRISAGPDLLHLLLGSEGQFGVLSQATIKIFQMPAQRCFGAILFPDFDKGVQFFRAVALRKWQPASLRLVDNTQFQMGQAMKIQSSSIFHSFGIQMARIYLTRWKGFKPDQMVAATCVFEGTQEEVEKERSRIFGLANEFGGFRAPDENGQFGYRLTFAIAYLRDLALDYGVIGESFETSAPWSRVLNLCKNVKELLIRETQKYGIKQQHILATCRVTQVYDSGACIYFYFAFNYQQGMSLEKALHAYENIEALGRNEILANGGSISHHHGVGKIRKRWLPKTIGQLGISVLESLRENLDPKNIFANGNLFDTENKSKL